MTVIIRAQKEMRETATKDFRVIVMIVTGISKHQETVVGKIIDVEIVSPQMTEDRIETIR